MDKELEVSITILLDHWRPAGQDLLKFNAKAPREFYHGGKGGHGVYLKTDNGYGKRSCPGRPAGPAGFFFSSQRYEVQRLSVRNTIHRLHRLIGFFNHDIPERHEHFLMSV